MALINGEKEKFNISFQFTPSSSHSETGSSEKTDLIINSVEASSIDSAVNLMNAYMAKELSLSHCRLIIFSEEVAYDGISDEIYTLTNDAQVRPSTNIIVSKNAAKDYLNNSQSPLENLITKNYEIFPNSSRYTGYVYDATLGDFINQLVSTTGEPIAILGGLNTNSKDSSNNSTQVNSIKSTNTSFVGENQTENLGVAVFKGDKLVGELSALDTLCLSIIHKKVNSFLIQAPDSDNPIEDIDVMLYPKRKISIDVKIVNGSPYITIKTHFIGRIYSMKENSKYLDDTVLNNLSSQVSNYLEKILTDYLYKTSLELKSDINDFGRYSAKNFLTVNEFDQYNWKKNYENSIFNVDADVSIKSGFLVTET